ncbi:MAG: 6-phospho-beta-glucosidase [Pseudomonadota bacterium]
MSVRLAILGGSSPFSAALFDALVAAAGDLPLLEVVLHGRDRRALALLTRHGRARLGALGWRVRQTTTLARALAGASVVVHQVRYGGLEGRAADEALSRACGLPPDETLGPGALRAALCMLPGLDATSAALIQHCPDAWVLNLTNPLSLATARMAARGVRRCLGICELPRVTVAQAAERLGVEPREVTWAYGGLNHRGFVVSMRHGARDLLAELPAALADAALAGIDGDTVRRLGALPTKYFPLLAGRPVNQARGRAALLAGLRARILDEIAADPRRSPPALRERYLAWYPEAVVPLLVALLGHRPALLEVNVAGPDGLVREGRALVGPEGVGALEEPPASAAVRAWIERFEAHERCAMGALAAPSFEAVRRVLAADPLVGAAGAEACARLVWNGMMDPNKGEMPC